MPELPAAAKRLGVGSDVLHASMFGLAYFVGAELGYALSLGPSVGGTFWPPSGIALAVFLAAPRRTWPQLLIAGIVANYVSDVVHGQALQASIAFAIANLSEPLIGALLIRKSFNSPITFTRLPEVVALALVVVFVSAPIAAAIGALAAEWWTQASPGFAHVVGR
jgi:integral membrane sensor domain MASE1